MRLGEGMIFAPPHPVAPGHKPSQTTSPPEARLVGVREHLSRASGGVISFLMLGKASIATPLFLFIYLYLV